MSATYNWSYKPGIANKYGFSIASSADNVRPSNACYIALFGNDITGNGSRQYPYKTLAAASLPFQNVFFILSAGVYRESPSTNLDGTNGIIVGDGDVIFDLFLNIPFSYPNGGGNFYNITFRNLQAGSAQCSLMRDCDLIGDTVSSISFFGARTYSLFKNFAGLNAPVVGTSTLNNGFNTFINIPNIQISADPTQQGAFNFCIFESCNINLQTQPNFDYCLFHNCSFKMNSGSYIPINDIPTLQALVAVDYPSGVAFTHSIIGDPLFNNPTIGDYTLSFNSPAKNLSYLGTYSGAKSIGYGLAASSGITSPFDTASTVNLAINTDSITIIDVTKTGSTESNLIVNLIQREIKNLPTYGFNADRNGQYVDSIPDLSGATVSPTQALNTPSPYLVQTGAIVYNTQTYQPGDRFTTVTGVTGFTTTALGVLQEIVEAPERHTVMARFSNGDGIITSGASLTNGYWYYVDLGTIVYDTVTYSATTSFKAIDTNSFSGSGVVELAMSTEQYQHYEINGKPYSNNSGDTRTGIILRGNGDPAYVRGGINITEFPINSKFIQIKYVFQVANLTP